MPYQNDMMSLADIVGPATAAGQAMTQDDLENQKNQIANQVAAGQAPAEIARPGLQNMFTQAQTGAEQGVAQQQQAKGSLDQALLPGGIKAGQAENETKYGAQKIQQFGQMGAIANQAAGLMDNVPPAARPAAMNQLAQKYGIDPQALGPLANGDPDMLRNFGQKLIQSSSDYQTKLMEGQVRNQGASDVEAQRAQSAQGVAQTMAGSRLGVAQTNAAARMSGVQNVIGQLTQKVAAGTATPEERQALDYANRTLQMQRSGNPFAAQLTGTDVQGNVPQVPGGNTPQQPQVPNNAPAMQQAAHAIWPNDDPSKYDYRMGPDGNLQRKAK